MRGQADVDQEMVENGGTLAVTALMARIMSSYGAPPSVIGKMVVTPTDEAAVLTRADLDAWNVRITRFVPGQEMPQAGEVARPRSDPPAAPSPIYPTQPYEADNVVKQRDARDRKHSVRRPGKRRLRTFATRAPRSSSNARLAVATSKQPIPAYTRPLPCI